MQCPAGLFLLGRSILSNVVDIEEAMQHTTLQHNRGACFLFGFAAAVPSIANTFMFAVLGRLGLPQNMLTATIRRLYIDNVGLICLRGEFKK